MSNGAERARRPVQTHVGVPRDVGCRALVLYYYAANLVSVLSTLGGYGANPPLGLNLLHVLRHGTHRFFDTAAADQIVCESYLLPLARAAIRSRTSRSPSRCAASRERAC